MKGLEIFEYNGVGYNPTMNYGEWRVAIANFGEHFDEERYNYLEAHKETDEVFVLLSGSAKLVIGCDFSESVMQTGKIYNVKCGEWHCITMKPGAKVAIVYVVAGLLIAIIGGTILEKLHLEKYIETEVSKKSCCCCCTQEQAIPEIVIENRWKYAGNETKDIFKSVFPYILLGVGIGTFIHNWIPESWVETVLGGKNPFGVILGVIVGTPMYADIFGTIPVAEALLGKGALLGTILAFMMAVTTLSLPSIIMLRKVMKTPLLVIFTGTCVVGITIVGYLFNIFQQFFM